MPSETTRAKALVIGKNVRSFLERRRFQRLRTTASFVQAQARAAPLQRARRRKNAAARQAPKPSRDRSQRPSTCSEHAPTVLGASGQARVLTSLCVLSVCGVRCSSAHQQKA